MSEWYRCPVCGYTTSVTNVHRSCPNTPKTSEMNEHWQRMHHGEKYDHAGTKMYRVKTRQSRIPIPSTSDNAFTTLQGLYGMLGKAVRMGVTEGLDNVKKAIGFLKKYVPQPLIDSAEKIYNWEINRD